MIRRLLVLITLCAIVIVGLSAGQLALHAETVKPAPLDENEYLHGTFELARHLDGFEKPLLSRGEFVISTQNGLIWKTTFPFPGITVLEDDGIFTITPNGDRNAIASGSETRQFVRMISSVLSGNWDILQSQFNIAENITQSNTWEAILTPNTNSAVATQVNRIAASGDIFVKTVTIEKPSSDRDVITFDDQVVGMLPLSPEFAKLFTDGIPE
ncbi:MAG: hypothetical protein AXW12_03580 [Thalassospira sp. Nap_22]|nr:MAG: hypothetical protein AXW12_03580 [Thalassospira sp. Nap_22]